MYSALRALALALVASVALAGAARRPATVFDLSDAVGKPVPALTLTAGDGSTVAFEGLRGKPTYVFLFAGWCGPCQEAMPFVRSAYAKYGDRVRFVGVDVLEEADAARAAVAAAALPFPVAIYPIDQLDSIVAPDVQLRAGTKYRIPADFLLDSDGVVRYVWHGLTLDAGGEPVDVLPSYLAKLGIE
ncbi:MAG: thiol:disulfide interchange protein tlpA [Candidatus Eremiobacteraeota bacterium]|nr:thiol:disulfide interchange protein tlpA [Candidatus Eremiobacteraeota bacterium]